MFSVCNIHKDTGHALLYINSYICFREWLKLIITMQVRLIGYSIEGSLFLVYEYIENGNLSQHLRGSGCMTLSLVFILPLMC